MTLVVLIALPSHLPRIGARPSIQPVVLQDEDEIKEDADVAQAQLGRVAHDAGPVALQRGVDDELQQREHAAAQIEQDGVDRPADGRLPLVVDVRLRDVLDDGDEELDVAESVDLGCVGRRSVSGVGTWRADGTHHVYPRPAAWISSSIDASLHHNCDQGRYSNHTSHHDTQDRPADPLRPLALVAPAVELAHEQRAEDHRVRREGEVVEAHGRLGREGVPRCILRADERRQEEGGGGDGIGEEAEHVDGREVDGQTRDGVAAPVGQRLGVKGERPAQDAWIKSARTDGSDSRRGRYTMSSLAS